MELSLGGAGLHGGGDDAIHLRPRLAPGASTRPLLSSAQAVFVTETLQPPNVSQ